MTVSLWLDGCFDGFHYAHANVIRQALYLVKPTPEDPQPRIVVGIHSDQEILKHKGPTLFEESERYALIRGCRWVDEVVEDVPYVTAIDITRAKNIDFVVHGDDPVYDADGQDCYGIYKIQGQYLECKRTAGVSTTSLIQRILLPEGRATEEIDEEQLETLVDLFAKAVPFSFPVIRYEELKVEADFDAVRKMWTQGKKVVYVGGGWDCFSSGHVEYLRRCKELFAAQDTTLVVGVWSDDELQKRMGEEPLLTLLERTLAIIQCKYADAVMISAPPTLSERDTTVLGLDALFNIKGVVASDVDERVIAKPRTSTYHHVEVPPLQSIDKLRQRLLSRRGLFEERQRRKGQQQLNQ